MKILFSSTRKAFLTAAMLGVFGAASVGGALAQNLFAPVVTVNDSAVTAFELQQRELMLSALRTPGDIPKIALEKLIDERLQMQAARSAGVTVSAETLQDGIAEFAQRTDQTPEEFLQALAQEGVAAESFRDFVQVGLAWRDLVRAKFALQSQISDGEIDRAVSNTVDRPAGFGSAQVLISELFLPANTPQATAQSEQLAEQIGQITTLDAFAAAARDYSIGPSAPRGGRVETWVPLGNLPAPIAQAFLTMNIGEVTTPFPLTNAFVIFQLRALQEIDTPAPSELTLDYAAYYIDGGNTPAAHAKADKLRASVDVCDDLYGVAKGLPPEILDRDTLPLSDVPQDVAIELAKLDVGESSTALTRANGQTLVFLMLCARNQTTEAEISRDVVRQQLLNDRLTSFSDGYLAELKADAIITYP